MAALVGPRMSRMPRTACCMSDCVSESSSTKVAFFLPMLEVALLLLAVLALIGVFVYRRSASMPGASQPLPQDKGRPAKRQRRKIIGSNDSCNDAIARSSETSNKAETESKSTDLVTELQPISSQDSAPVDPSLCGTCKEKQWKRECVQQLCRPCCRSSKPRVCDVHTDHIEKIEVRQYVRPVYSDI